MSTCERYREQLWDELFGLLEASESANLQRHLEDCADCQAAMHDAQAGQRLLTTVARLAVDVPRFTPPTEEPILSTSDNNRPILTLPRRSRTRLWVAAAAAILVCLGVPYGIYQNGLSARARDVQEATRHVEDLQQEARELEARAQDELKSFQSATLARFVRLQVLGPATYQPGFLSQYQVVASGLDGRPQTVDLMARLVDRVGKVVFEKRFSGSGAFSVVLPAGLPLQPRSTAQLEFRAAGSDDMVRADLSVQDAQYITELVTDKQIYHPGETVYFRSLTLLPFDLKPPAGR